MLSDSTRVKRAIRISLRNARMPSWWQTDTFDGRIGIAEIIRRFVSELGFQVMSEIERQGEYIDQAFVCRKTGRRWICEIVATSSWRTAARILDRRFRLKDEQPLLIVVDGFADNEVGQRARQRRSAHVGDALLWWDPYDPAASLRTLAMRLSGNDGPMVAKPREKSQILAEIQQSAGTLNTGTDLRRIIQMMGLSQSTFAVRLYGCRPANISIMCRARNRLSWDTRYRIQRIIKGWMRKKKIDPLGKEVALQDDALGILRN